MTRPKTPTKEDIENDLGNQRAGELLRAANLLLLEMIQSESLDDVVSILEMTLAGAHVISSSKHPIEERLDASRFRVGEFYRIAMYKVQTTADRLGIELP